MPSAAHRHKRQLQAPITSYFNHADRDDYLALSTQSNASTAPFPSLPPTVQASLLSVGMRVRKSVPEGYKTHPKTSLYSIQTTEHGATDIDAPAQATTRSAELVPYCGLHKTGAYAAQPELNTSFFAPPTGFFHADVPDVCGALFGTSETDLFLPSNSSSQESAASTLSADFMPATVALPVRAHKRRFQDDFDDFDGEDERDGHDTTTTGTDYVLPPSSFSRSFSSAPPIDDPPVSPRSRYPVSHTSMPDFDLLTSVRPVARPQTRRKGSAARGLGLVALRRGAVQEEVGGDFGEAEFLREWDGGDEGEGGEVEMGGV